MSIEVFSPRPGCFVHLEAGKYYVIDRFSGPADAPVAGPYESAANAEQGRREVNIAGDCIIVRRRA